MATSPSRQRIRQVQRRLEREHQRPFVVQRASNGEVAILPACRVCGQAEPEWLPPHKHTTEAQRILKDWEVSELEDKRHLEVTT